MPDLISPQPASDPTKAIEVAQNYLVNSQYSHMLTDGTFSASTHNPDVDSHVINLLDGVESEDIHHNDYTVVTAQRNISVEGPGNITIPKIVKLQISNIDNSVQSVLESK